MACATSLVISPANAPTTIVTSQKSAKLNRAIISFKTKCSSLSSEFFRPISRSLKDLTPTPESITQFALDSCTLPAAHAPDRARVIGAARGRPRAADPARITLPLSSFPLSPLLFFLSYFSFFLFSFFFFSFPLSSPPPLPRGPTAPPLPAPGPLCSAWPGPPPLSRFLLGPLQRRPSLLPARAAGQLAAARAPHPAHTHTRAHAVS